jgi:hypothetical protein
VRVSLDDVGDGTESGGGLGTVTGPVTKDVPQSGCIKTL